MDGPPTWSRTAEIPRVVLHPPHLRKTLRIALTVGTVLFCINQLDVVLAGRADARVWMKIAVTYVVPFVVSNWGLLVGLRREPKD
jgi:hypothetical protein